MYTRDYIMRMIEQLTQVLLRVLALKEEKEYPKALEELHLGGTRMLGVDWPFFSRLGSETMIEILNRRAEMDRRVFAVAADLLMAEADILRLEENEDEAWMRMVNAFSLYCEALKGQDTEDVRAKAFRVLDEIDGYELPSHAEYQRRWLLEASHDTKRR
jgi:hypothetical protein